MAYANAAILGSDLRSKFHYRVKKLVLRFIYSVLSDRTRRSFMLSSLLSKVTQIDATQNKELYSKLNTLFNLSGNETTLVYPSANAVLVWDGDVNELISKAVHNPAKQKEYCKKLLALIPKELKYSEDQHVPEIELGKLVEFIRDNEVTVG